MYIFIQMYVHIYRLYLHCSSSVPPRLEKRTTYINIWIYICTYIHTNMCIYSYKYMYIYIYIYIDYTAATRLCSCSRASSVPHRLEKRTRYIEIYIYIYIYVCSYKFMYIFIQIYVKYRLYRHDEALEWFVRCLNFETGEPSREKQYRYIYIYSGVVRALPQFPGVVRALPRAVSRKAQDI